MTNQPSVCTDAELRSEICSKNAPQREKALERFVRGAFGYLSNSLTGYAVKKNWQCSSDKVREICADAYVEFQKNTGKPGFFFQKEDACGYFFQIARNILSQRLDFGKPATEAYDARLHDRAALGNPHSDLERNERHQSVRNALAKLNPEERMILSLYATDYKSDEIAEMMQEKHDEIVLAMNSAGLEAVRRDLWTEPYTKTRLQRARQKLRDLLDPDLGKGN
jgi:DNA-directed RNA polymerase specialized sigma24 family protein